MLQIGRQFYGILPNNLLLTKIFYYSSDDNDPYDILKFFTQNDSVEVFEFLVSKLDQGRSTKSQHPSKEISIFAARKNRLDLLIKLVDFYSVRILDQSTPIIALDNKNMEMLEWIIKQNSPLAGYNKRKILEYAIKNQEIRSVILFGLQLKIVI